MARVCDRSPCEGLLGALGLYIFGTQTNGRLEGFVLITAVRYMSPEGTKKLKRHTVDIEYCPFCGTRIEEVNALVVERFLRARKRRKTKPGITA